MDQQSGARTAGFERVFQPIRIGSVEVKNRIVMTPHGTAHRVPDSSRPGFFLARDTLVDHFRERARGGVGLLMQGGTIVHETSQGPFIHAFGDEAVPRFREITQAVHEHGSLIFLQLLHVGHHADRTLGRNGNAPPTPPLSASDVPPIEDPLRAPRPMTKDDIRDVIEGYRRSASNAQAAGYDGLEISATHSYLMEQFLSPFFNKRNDEYGGPLENRLRLLREVIRAVRGAVDSRMPVGIRLICDEDLPGGLAGDDCAEVARRLDADALLDFFDLDIGTYHRPDVMITPLQFPALLAVDAIKRVRSAISRAVVIGTPGRLTNPRDAERLLSEGAMDMVGMTRQLLVDPDWVRKIREGRTAEIRPCIGYNLCRQLVWSTGCVMNPAHGREREWGHGTLTPVERPRRVVVVGGGPAGMEAARVARLRGHDVVLFEARQQLGGALAHSAVVPNRISSAYALEWFERELSRLGVVIQLCAEADEATIRAQQPDVLVIATGARYDRRGTSASRSDPIPGWDLDFVFAPEQVLEDPGLVNGHVVVFDDEGDITGGSLAQLLNSRGAQVTFITRYPVVAPRHENTRQNRALRGQLASAGVGVRTSMGLERITDGSVVLRNELTQQQEAVNGVKGVVVVGARHSRTPVSCTLETLAEHVHVIGDALSPRTMIEATFEGHRAGRAA